VSFIFDVYWGIFFDFFHSVCYPSPDFLLHQTLLEESSVQDREPDSLLNDPIDDDGGLVAVNPQIVDSPVRQMTDGKGVICSIYLSAADMN